METYRFYKALQLVQLHNCINKFLATCVLFVHLLSVKETTNYSHVLPTEVFLWMLVYIDKHLNCGIKPQNNLLNYSRLYPSKLRKICNWR
jgi:hypothetical protein